MWESILEASAWVIPVLTGVILHEIAHGWVAEKFGDPTARALGRITLNPLKHIDPVGTILFPTILIAANSPIVFGSAKPVPVNFNALYPPRRGMICVALAGVAMNAILATIACLLLHIENLITPEQAPWLFKNLYHAIMFNSVLISFNLIPLLPLDGGRVVTALLSGRPRRLWQRTERFGIVILLVLLLVPPYFGLDFLSVLLSPAYSLIDFFIYITGNSQ